MLQHLGTERLCFAQHLILGMTFLKGCIIYAY